MSQPDLARLRAFVEQVKGRHREWSTLADGIRCSEDYRRWPCDAARLATLAEGLLGVAEAATHAAEWLESRPDYTEGDAATSSELRHVLAALEVGKEESCP